MRELSEFEKEVIEQKGTERPFSGEFCQHDAQGVYCCKKCDAQLYRSEHKFEAHCGWPAFDDEIAGAVERIPDADGHRVEILCARCGGHLGHVFEGEGLTKKNIRHCVNSVSMVFKPIDELEHQPQFPLELATFGGGCFWCIEAIFSSLDGVSSVTPGYAGGEAKEASYQAVCGGNTAHAEVVQIEFNPKIISFETLLDVFWQSHDPTTLNQQGNDIGPQYRSVIFAHNDKQAAVATQMIARLSSACEWSAPIVTQVSAYDGFYPAENYHKDYFELHAQEPYCQMVIRPKLEKIKGLFPQRQK